MSSRAHTAPPQMIVKQQMCKQYRVSISSLSYLQNYATKKSIILTFLINRTQVDFCTFCSTGHSGISVDSWFESAGFSRYFSLQPWGASLILLSTLKPLCFHNNKCLSIFNSFMLINPFVCPN